MIKTILLASLIASSAAASAFEGKCTTSDLWRGPDKTKHAIAGAAIGAAVTAATEKPLSTRALHGRRRALASTSVRRGC